MSRPDDEPDAATDAKSSPRTWTLHRALIASAVGWPFALGWHLIVNAIFGVEWRWGRELFHAVFVWSFVCFAMYGLERRKRAKAPPKP